MIIICQSLLKNMKISGITLFPFIFLQKPEDRHNKILINHEKIHIRQQLEMLVIFFYIAYITEYFFWYFTLKNPHQAYRRISFEREAYANEKNLDYLSQRQLWSFRHYLKNN